jgi:hypothetical protein
MNHRHGSTIAPGSSYNAAGRIVIAPPRRVGDARK